MYIEEYNSPDLTFIKEEANVVTDALSRLEINLDLNPKEALITKEMHSNWWYCYVKEEMNYDSHPLSYQQLEKAQLADKQVMEILKLDKSPYKYHSFHGGGTIRQLIYKNDKIVIAKLLQKHVIDWYHTVLCHLGMD